MLSLSPLKIMIIVVVALVLVGPDKLPGLARQIGGAWKAFRSFSTRVEDEVRSNMPDLPSTGDIARFARSPVAILDSLAKLDTDPLEPDPGLDETTQGDALQVDPGAAAQAHLTDREPSPETSEPPARPTRPASSSDAGPIDPSLN